MAKFTYQISQLNSSEMKISLIYDAKDSMFMNLYKQAVAKLEKKEGVRAEGNPKLIEEFKIPDNQKKYMFPTVQTAVKKNLKAVCKIPKARGFDIQFMELDDITYTRVTEKDWKVKLDFIGSFTRK